MFECAFDATFAKKSCKVHILILQKSLYSNNAVPGILFIHMYLKELFQLNIDAILNIVCCSCSPIYFIH